jgi:tetratricopeptide (TPR) repeat protein
MSASSRLSLWPMAVAALLVPAAPGQDTPVPTEADVPRLVRELGDDNFQVRERAGELLKQVGIVARPALLAAARSKDPEVRFRASALLSQMTWYTRDDHEEVKKLLAGYNGQAPRHRVEMVISWLVRTDDTAEKQVPLARRIPVLVRILRFEEDGLVCRATVQALEALTVVAPPERAEATAVLARAAPGEPRSTGDWLVRYCAAADDPARSAAHLERAIREERARLRADPTAPPAVLTLLLEKRHARRAAAGRAVEAGTDLAEIFKLEPAAANAVRLMEWHLRRREWPALEAVGRHAAVAGDARALYLAAQARRLQGDAGGAADLVKQALSLSADREYPHYLAGDFLIRRDRLEEAQAEFARVHELAPKDDACDFSAHVLLSGAYKRAGRHADAAAQAEAALRVLEPRLARNDERFAELPVWTRPALQAHLQWMKLRAAEAAGGRTGVEQALTALLAGPVCDASTAAELHQWLKAAKRPADAAAVLDRSAEYFRGQVKVDGNIPAATNALAWLLARTDSRIPEACELARRAVLLSPGTARYWDTLAEAVFRAGEPAKAQAYIGRALELEPGDAFYLEQSARFAKGAPQPR